MMKAALYDRYGGPEVLYVGSAPIPALGAGEVLIRVHAASVNAIDVTIRSGALRLFTGRKFPRGTGLDFTGEIMETGEGEHTFKKGDVVWGSLPHGGMGSVAEYLSVPPEQLSLIPTSLDSVSAAALPVVGVTSIIALRDIAKLQPSESLLIRGATGGVGSVAVQLGRAMGVRVTALASADKLDFVRSLGAEQAFDYAATFPRDLGRFDVILDTVGTDTWSYRRLLTSKGRMVTICPDPKRPLSSFMRIFASVIFGSRRIRFFSAKPKARLLRALAGYVEEGAIRPVIGAIHPLSEIGLAHRNLETGGQRGRQLIHLS